MATSSSLPSSPAAQSSSQTAPPNFYAQAATAQPPAASAKPDTSEDTKKFRAAIEKLAGVEGILTKMEKLKPNGKNIEKKIKAIAQSFKDLSSEVLQGEEGDGDSDTDLDSSTAPGAAAGSGGAASPPPASPGGVAGTGA